MGLGESRLHLPVRIACLEPFHRLRQPGDLDFPKDQTPKAPVRELPQSRGVSNARRRLTCN